MSESKLPSKKLYQTLVVSIRKEIERGRTAVQHAQARTYWNVGKLISRDILKNQKRAGYGEHLFESLEDNLKIDKSVLHQTVKFYELYPKIVDSNPQLTWSHYRQLVFVDNPKRRKRLEQGAARKKISVSKLKQEIKKNAPKTSDVISVKPARPAGGAEIPVTKLTPRKGVLYTYKIDSVETDAVLVDCGFETIRRIFLSNLGTFTAGGMIRSKYKDKKYAIVPINETAKSLYTYNAEIIKIIDGDTISVKIDLGFDTLEYQTLRLRGIDVPEMDTEVGKAAKVFVQNALKDMKTILIRSSASDKYDRYLADVFYGDNETFLNQELLDVGLALGYRE